MRFFLPSILFVAFLSPVESFSESFYERIHQRPGPSSQNEDKRRNENQDKQPIKTSYSDSEREAAVDKLKDKEFMDDSFSLDADDLKEMKQSWLMCSFIGFKGETCEEVKDICMSKWKRKGHPTRCI